MMKSSYGSKMPKMKASLMRPGKAKKLNPSLGIAKGMKDMGKSSLKMK